MQVKYTIKKVVNIPDEVGICVDEQVKMITVNVKQNVSQCGKLLASYASAIKDRYNVVIQIYLVDDEEYRIIAVKSDDMKVIESFNPSRSNHGCEIIYDDTACMSNINDVIGNALTKIEEDTKIIQR